MKKMILTVLSTFFLNSVVHAEKNSDTVLECGKNFSIKKTAVAHLFQGQLTLGLNNYLLNCEEVEQGPSNIMIIWNCVEDRPGDGKFLVHVETGGVVGTIKSAYVEQEQMFPLKPMPIATYTCRSTI